MVFGLGSRLSTGQWGDGLWGAFIGYSVYFGIGFLSKLYYKKETLGGGDLKLGAGIGAVWGVSIVSLTLYYSFFIGGIIGITLILTRQKSRNDIMPFGPMIILAGILAILTHKQVIEWLFRLS